MAKKKERNTQEGEEEKKYDYAKVYLPKGLETILQRYCDKFLIGTDKATKLALSLLQEWAREIAKKYPDLALNTDL